MAWIICIFALLLGGCGQKSHERHYMEIVDQASEVNTPGDTLTKNNVLNWVSPKGWREEAGTDMRLASFHQVDDPAQIDCYIVALSGAAGGLDANLGRWMRQLGIEASGDDLKILINLAQTLKTKGGFEARIFDFSALQTHGSSSDKSMLAAMISLGQTTIFVKMTGSIESVKQNKANFLKLIGSITRQ